MSCEVGIRSLWIWNGAARPLLCMEWMARSCAEATEAMGVPADRLANKSQNVTGHILIVAATCQTLPRGIPQSCQCAGANGHGCKNAATMSNDKPKLTIREVAAEGRCLPHDSDPRDAPRSAGRAQDPRGGRGGHQPHGLRTDACGAQLVQHPAPGHWRGVTADRGNRGAGSGLGVPDHPAPRRPAGSAMPPTMA